uniref:Sphingosine-1-phosphate receptor 3 n=1 Tax=Nothobranchius pienaari TaxID=704102 RepID=A0A1A8MJI4_9TELE
MNKILLHYNYTGKLSHRQTFSTNPGTMDIQTIVFLVFSSFIVLENLTVLVAIWSNNRFHNRMYYFIGNLALKKYVAFCITVFTLLLLAMSVLYACIYILVKSSGRKVNKHSNSEHAMSLLRTVIIVVGVFIVCWTPIFILLLVDVACGQRYPILYSADGFIFTAIINSAMNPVIYTLASREMRRTFLGLVCGVCYKPSGSQNRQFLEPSRSRSKSWNSQNNPEPAGLQADRAGERGGNGQDAHRFLSLH